MNRKERRAAQKKGAPVATPMAATLASAFHAHQGGHRADAERLYREVLAAEPRNAAALHLLGALMHQTARSDEAISLMRQAIAIDPNNPDYHYNLGSVLNASGRSADAIESLSKAIALKPQYAEAHFELGNAHARTGAYDSAERSLRRALELQPSNTVVMNNLGRVLRAMSRPDEAIAIWQRAVALQPNLAIAHLNIGMARREQNRLDEAEQSLRSTLAIQADQPEAVQQLAAVLIRTGRAGEALPMIAQALARSDLPELQATFAQCLLAVQELRPEPVLRDLFRRAIEDAWIRPALLAPLGLLMLKAHPTIGAAIQRIAGQWGKVPANQLLPTVAEIEAAAHEPLVTALLNAAPNSDIDVERFLTVLRATMLQQALSGNVVGDKTLDLFASLARQCFINEYVFAETEDEGSRVQALQTSMGNAIRGNDSIAPLQLVALAAYRPLHRLDAAASLSARDWPACVAELLRQQVEEPLREIALRDDLPVLTPIAAQAGERAWDGGSPRWVKAASTLRPRPVEAVMRAALPGAGTLALDFAAAPDVLVAGCGTGESAIEAALSYKNARVLAVDESADDLAYARRQAQSLNLPNIEFAQAESAQIASIQRNFDVIESAQLPHLSDPWAAWSALISLLRAGGVMRIALFGEMAHRVIGAAQDFARQGNYQSDNEGIRRLRQNLLRLPADNPAAKVSLSADFFTAGSCRALFFDAPGTPMTLQEIKAFLDVNDLKLMGVETAPELQQAFVKRFPDSGARTDLAAWQVVASENPDAFVSMYQLWICKPLASDAISSRV